MWKNARPTFEDDQYYRLVGGLQLLDEIHLQRIEADVRNIARQFSVRLLGDHSNHNIRQESSANGVLYCLGRVLLIDGQACVHSGKMR